MAPVDPRILAQSKQRLLPVPIKRTTVSEFFGRELSAGAETKMFFAGLAAPVATVRTSDELVVSKVDSRPAGPCRGVRCVFSGQGRQAAHPSPCTFCDAIAP